MAPDAFAVWMAPVITAEIEAVAERHEDSGGRNFQLAGLPAATHLFIDAVGTQHIVLKSGHDHVTLHVTGALVAAGPSRITFECIGVEALQRHRDTLSMLIALLHPASPRAGITTDWLVERLELRNALIALDGDCVGAKWHEIARVIYGAARVDAERSDSESTMRHKIKRDLARGRRFVRGSYRDLLRTAKVRALGSDR